MSRSPLDYLRHVLDETEYIARVVERLSREEFLDDETEKRAMVRSIEVIGEAVKNVPEDFRVRFQSGTLPYMAPEVLGGDPPNVASDIYALGVTIYELVTGQLPFAHGDIADQIRYRRAPPLESGDTALDRAVAQALLKDPKRRPSSAGALMARGRARPRRRRSTGSRRVWVWILLLFFTLGAVVVMSPYGRRFWPERPGPTPERVVLPLPGRLELDLPPSAEDRRLFLRFTTYHLSGTIAGLDEPVLQVRVGEVLADVFVDPHGRFERSFELPDGVPTVVRIDGDSLENTVHFEVEVDREPPVVRPVSPAAVFTRESAAEVVVEMSDAHLLRVSLNGAEADLVDGRTHQWRGLALRKESTNRFMLAAVDRAGNESTLDVTLTHDTLSPGLARSHPTPGQEIGDGSSTAIELTFDEPVTGASVAGISLEVALGGRKATGSLPNPDEPGDWPILWTATDRAGNKGQGTLALVRVDTTKPALEIRGDGTAPRRLVGGSAVAGGSGR